MLVSWWRPKGLNILGGAAVSFLKTVSNQDSEKKTRQELLTDFHFQFSNLFLISYFWKLGIFLEKKDNLEGEESQSSSGRYPAGGENIFVGQP